MGTLRWSGYQKITIGGNRQRTVTPRRAAWVRVRSTPTTTRTPRVGDHGVVDEAIFPFRDTINNIYVLTDEDKLCFTSSVPTQWVSKHNRASSLRPFGQSLYLSTLPS